MKITVCKDNRIQVKLYPKSSATSEDTLRVLDFLEKTDCDVYYIESISGESNVFPLNLINQIELEYMRKYFTSLKKISWKEPPRALMYVDQEDEEE